MTTRLSIHDLPAEILGMILFEITEQSEKHYCWLLASVCQSWNHVVQNTPQLWTRITASIRRSMPLDLAHYRERLVKAKQALWPSLYELTC